MSLNQVYRSVSPISWHSIFYKRGLLVSQHCPGLQVGCLIKLSLLHQSDVSCWMSTISLPTMHSVHLLPHCPGCCLFVYKPMSTVYSFSLKRFYSGHPIIHFSPSCHPLIPSFFSGPCGILRTFFWLNLWHVYVYLQGCTYVPCCVNASQI